MTSTGKSGQSLRHRNRFESCIVSAPGFLSELKLSRHYRRPWQTRAGAFVDELLAASLQPERSLAEVGALSEADRASLRRAVVASAGCEQEWRWLYGCHLTADERLFAVMYWCWQRRLGTRQQLRDSHEAQFAEIRAGVADDLYAKLGLAGVVRSSAAVEAALGGAAWRSVAELVPPKSFGALKASDAHAAWSRNFTKLFDNPLARFAADINRIISVTGTVSNIRALTDGVSGASNPIEAAMAKSVALPHIHTSVTAAVTGERFKHLMGLATPKGLTPWTVPSGLTEMVASWQQNTGAIAALARLQVKLPAVAAMAGMRVNVPGAAALDDISRLGAAVEAFQRIQRLGEPMQELAEAIAVVDAFDRQWQNEALYFILSGFLAVCDVWELRQLASLTREEVEATVLLALETALSDEQFVVALRGEVARAPYINASQATNLDHALEHAGRREYVHACAALYWGLEGAFWEVGYATAVVTLQRTDPTTTTRVLGFESMVKRLKLGQEMKTFMVRGLYGTAGNPYRHGGAGSGERRQVLLGVAALAGWFEEFTGVQALTALVTATGAALPAAIQQVLKTPRQLTP